MNIKEIKNLVFNGGGFRGIAFIGALKHLETNNFETQSFKKEQIQKIVGTSSGSVFAFLYTIGYTPDELLNIILDMNLKEFCSLSLTNLFKNLGLDNGQKVISWLKKLAQEKNISPDITFQELKIDMNKELYVVCTNLNSYKTEIMSWESAPDLSIIQAIRMSIAVPFVFTPIKFKDNLYVDGALLSEFPIHMFKNKQQETLIFKLSEKVEDEESKRSIRTIYDFSYHVIKCIISKSKNKEEKNFYVLNIATDQRDFLNFNMCASKKLDLFNTGIKSAQDFCKKYEETSKV